VQTPAHLSTQHSSHHDEGRVKPRHTTLYSLWARGWAQRHTGRADLGLLMEGLCPLLGKKGAANIEKWFITICISSTLQEFGEKNHVCFLSPEIIGLIQPLTG